MTDFKTHHTCLSVADIDKAAAWYQQAFGFEIERRFEIPIGAQVAHLRTPGGARLEVTEITGNAQGNAWRDPAGSLATRGYTHVAFEVDDLEAAFAQVVASGGEPVWEPRDGIGGIRIAFVHDNEGNLIELYHTGEVPPA